MIVGERSTGRRHDVADVKFTYNLEIDPWDDLSPNTPDGLISRIGIMPDGTESGRPVIIFVTEFRDGSEALGQITWFQLKQIYELMVESPVVVLDEI